MAILVLLVGLFLLRESRSGPVKAFDDLCASQVALVHGWAKDFAIQKGWVPKPEAAPVVLVAINDSSVANHPWPWTPLDFSLFVQAAIAFKPELVGINEVLDWDRANLVPSERQKLVGSPGTELEFAL